ncbi:MAG: quinone oxidoreductase family protein [Actinomycetota bacterium]
MRCAWVQEFNETDPAAGLRLGDMEVKPPPGWVRVDVVAASVNHHDVWSLRGVGLPADRLPMVLGTDAAGIDEDGRPVVVHAVIAPDDGTDETLHPRRTLLSEKHHGTFAEHVWVPRRNLVAKDPGLSFEHAACLPTAWLTAWRMLTRHAGLGSGGTVLVQGATGGVATAAIVLARGLGHEVWATSRSEAGREFAEGLGAHSVEPGARLPHQVDAVIETVGDATWAHSLACLRPGGTVVVSGATSGAMPPAHLNRIFFRSLRVIGSTMGTRAELEDLQDFLVTRGLTTLVANVRPFDDLPVAIRHLAEGRTRGKEVVRVRPA